MTMSGRAAIRYGRDQLAPRLGGEGALAARWLLMEATGRPNGPLLEHMEEPLEESVWEHYAAMVARCAAGEPVQYVLGSWDFAGLRLTVDRRALIPRPETEMLAIRAASLVHPGDRVADVGCGTGCIGLYIAQTCPHTDVTLLDISPDALALAGENATALGLSVTLTQADMTLPLPGGPYHLIVSNPPYIARDELAALDPSVAGYEPRLALDGGPDGLDGYRALARRAQDSLVPGGWLLAELGLGQQAAAEALFTPTCEGICLTRDLAGIDRVLSARRRIRL